MMTNDQIVNIYLEHMGENMTVVSVPLKKYARVSSGALYTHISIDKYNALLNKAKTYSVDNIESKIDKLIKE